MDALQTQTVNSTTAPQPNYIPGLIAVVGCDGTGKSTLTTDLVKSLQQHWQTERRYLGLLSGEDGDKIKTIAVGWRLAGTATGGQILENPKHENQISGAMGGGDYVLLLAAKNGESTQGSATGAKWRSGGQRSLPAG
ncbi:ATP-binding protein yghR [Escherichia coli]|uniref:ATP-binding protein yghR n=1 Tax=Escherichia coli TaxID=562 RepID=A0A376UGR2_ECOLX|nr:ATP-binding protein yghR [Escherichia coli]